MIRVGLVDDQPYDLEKLAAIIGQLDEAQIVFATQDPEEAYRQVKKDKVDLLIADIEMPGLSGYELAHFVHSYALKTAVIFVTGHSGYAVHAFELQVHDYIMKPYTRERLLQSVRRFMEKHQEQDAVQGNLIIKQKSEIHIIRKPDIVFIERTGRTTTIVTTGELYETYQPLAELEEKLKERDFFRSHRSFLINIHHVKNFSLYSKHSYSISFYPTKRTAMMTKEKMDEFQTKYF
ncbi:two component transcriptional regulator, LytTR family [Paenibacillus sp. UNCCL117]|uniref:LytR/AlgR family response regulator transcription factor n=1 Tax=unclassified Paenibacillus TaxID=185978 RepID=UPI00088066ED|nr:MULTISPECIES: LytTR family DNA-binding domain-containing protein [unclassified Paenibacillus]SDD76647.1 two component transcriptional regulator, LytTR family [Paenibacillus sp. cl123]SFW52508.1 two component transcriptional regulator, LytTR family [Paenibacillus sp. UNCCL117]